MSSRLLLILGILFWSGNYVMGRAVVATIPPITLAYIRWLLAFIFFLPFCWHELKDHWGSIKKNWGYYILLGMTGVMGFNFCQYLAVKYTTAINATIINSSTPMFTAIASYIFIKEALAPKQVAGIVLSIIGVVSIITNNQITRIFSMSFNMGDIFMLLGVIVNTVYYLTLKKKGRMLAPPRTLFLVSIMGGLLASLPIALLDVYNQGTGWIANLSSGHYLSLIYFAVFPSILSMLFFNRAILDLGPVKTSIYVNLGIVFTSILGILFLGESFRIAHLLGACLIVSGVWLTNSSTVKETLETEINAAKL